MEQVVGFCGPIGAGKDCAAEIAEEFGYKKVGFADHLKNVCGCLTGHNYNLREVKDQEVLPGVTGRKVLETIGATMRSLNQDFWLNSLFERNSGPIAICDVRYKNEVEAIRERGGFVIKIIREGCERTGHESDNWEELESDFVIINDKSLDDFKKEIRHVLGFINEIHA